MVLLLLVLLGCTRDEPVLTGIPAEPLLDGLQSAADARAEAPSVEPEAPTPYARPEGVTVDAGHLGGRSFSTSRDTIADQLGPLVSSRALSGDRGEELVFERGTLRVADNTIYMLKIPLQPPRRRHEALAAAGLPTIADKYLVLNREYRLNHKWGFRRIRMSRVEDSELVTDIEVWRWLPGEHLQRR